VADYLVVLPLTDIDPTRPLPAPDLSSPSKPEQKEDFPDNNKVEMISNVRRIDTELLC